MNTFSFKSFKQVVNESGTDSLVTRVSYEGVPISLNLNSS